MSCSPDAIVESFTVLAHVALQHLNLLVELLNLLSFVCFQLVSTAVRPVKARRSKGK